MDDADPRSILKRGAKRTLWVRAGHGSHDDVVVKRFHAPGIFGRFRDPARAAGEERALRESFALGLPVPEPLAVRRHADGVDLLMRSIDGAVSLAELVRLDPATTSTRSAPIARELGSLLARVALAGLHHPDLHAGNVLVDKANRAWLVDLRGARAGGAFTWREHEGTLTVLAADLRERTSGRMRARVLIASLRALRRAGRSDVPRAREVAARIETAARLRRRDVVARSSRRWFRSSSVAVPMQRASSTGIERAVRARRAEEADCWVALDAGGATSVSGSAREVRRAWRTAARLCEHAVPAPEPLVLVLGPRTRAVFGPFASAPQPVAPATLGVPASRAWSAVAGDPRLRQSAAASLGRLLGLLYDRALALEGALEDSVAFDARGAASVVPTATLRACDPRDPARVLRVARAIAVSATERERARFIVAFLGAQQLPARDLFALRERLVARTSGA